VTSPLTDPWHVLLGLGLERWLREHSGWSVAAMNEDAARAAVQQRLKATGLGPADYWLRLQQDADEAHALLDALLVHDTRFFRDRSPFLHLTALAARRRRPMRVLSIPCAGGEEALSCAIALHQGGLAWEQIDVTGVDLSEALVERARRGRYPRRALEDLPPPLRELYFRCRGMHCEPIAPLRARVRYLRGNLLDPPPLDGPFDAIFCRNLLVYFDADNRRRALAILRGWLAPGGVLYLGHAENGPWLEEGFRPLRPRTALAWVPREPRMPARRRRTRRDLALPRRPRGAAGRRLQQAERLYAQGRVAEAMELLRGLIYLYPQHWHLLQRMAAWAEAAGEANYARRYRRWAERVRRRREGAEA